MSPTMPTSISRYQVRALLGEGTFGAVYRAFDPKMQREIALKVLKADKTTSPEAVKRFLREAVTAGNLRHAHIVPVFDVGRAGDVYYIASAFINGRTLASAVVAGGGDLRQAAEWTAQLASALGHAHQRGVLHRDVKPANAMVDEADLLQLMDFGLARLTTSDSTTTGAVLGTIAYMAPEQAAGENERVGPASDLYSAGVVLYQLLTGELPFGSGHPATVIYRIVHTAAPLPSQHRPGLDAGLEAICLKAMAKDPARRYRSGEEMAAALRGWAPMAQPPTAPLPAVRPRRESEIETIVPPSPRSPVPPPTVVQPASRRSSSGARFALLGGFFVVALLLAASGGGVYLAFLSPTPPTTGSVAIAPPAATTPPRAPAPALPPKDKDKDAPTPPTPPPNDKDKSVPPPPPVPPTAPRPLPLDCTGDKGVSEADVRKAQEAWASYLGRKVEEEDEIAPGVKMKFVLVPPGKFVMGSPEAEKERSTTEVQHEVEITKPFYLGVYDVTQAQYEAVTGQTPSSFEGADLPVEDVSWRDADDFAKRLTGKARDGPLYRLPTEAEWEYSCRGGRSSLLPFGIGDGASLSSRDANFDCNYPYGGADKGPYLQKTTPVGTYKPNALGLYDMHGNVWQWCSDCYGPYPEGKVTDPTGPLPAPGSFRVLRGGSGDNFAKYCRAAYRGRSAPDYRGYYLGLRLARAPSGLDK